MPKAHFVVYHAHTSTRHLFVFSFLLLHLNLSNHSEQLFPYKFKKLVLCRSHPCSPNTTARARQVCHWPTSFLVISFVFQPWQLWSTWNNMSDSAQLALSAMAMHQFTHISHSRDVVFTSSSCTLAIFRLLCVIHAGMDWAFHFEGNQRSEEKEEASLRLDISKSANRNVARFMGRLFRVLPSFTLSNSCRWQWSSLVFICRFVGFLWLRGAIQQLHCRHWFSIGRSKVWYSHSMPSLYSFSSGWFAVAWSMGQTIKKVFWYRKRCSYCWMLPNGTQKSLSHFCA